MSHRHRKVLHLAAIGALFVAGVLLLLADDTVAYGWVLIVASLAILAGGTERSGARSGRPRARSERSRAGARSGRPGARAQ